MVGLIVLLVASFALWSVARSDQLLQKRLVANCCLCTRHSEQQISYDQESVAIWDEAVVNTHDTFNLSWVDVNLGVWMYEYFKHDRIYIIDAKERVTYAMADGQQVASNGDVTNAAIRNLIARAPPINLARRS